MPDSNEQQKKNPHESAMSGQLVEFELMDLVNAELMWLAYRKAAITPHASNIQLSECKKAFTAGLAQAHDIICRGIATLPDDVAVDALKLLKVSISMLAKKTIDEQIHNTIVDANNVPY